MQLLRDILYFAVWAGFIFLMMRYGCGAHIMGHGHHHGATGSDDQGGKVGVPLSSRVTRTIPVLAFGMSLSAFFVISYVICIIGYLIFPGLPINHAALSIFLPGFELLTWQTFLLGLIESFVWGWYIALIFGPLFNFFVHRQT